LADRLRESHLVITGAGASTAADLLVIGGPASSVPLPHGGSREEQRRNAQTLADAGAGWHVPEPEFTPEALARLLGGLFASPTRLAEAARRSEEHTSELQSRENLVCRLLLEKKKT